MQTKRDTFRLGLAVLVMSILFFVCLTYIGQKGFSTEAQKSLLIRFHPGQSIPELTNGSLVRHLGLPVGEVKESRIVLDTDPNKPDSEAMVFLEVRALVAEEVPLRSDCKIIATGPPLGGKGMLEIIDPGHSSKPADPTQPIYGQVVGFQAVLDVVSSELDESDPDSLLASIKSQMDEQLRESLIYKIHASIDDINAVTASLKHELESDQEEVLLYKLHAMLDGVNHNLELATALIDDNKPKIDRTMSSVETAAQTLNEDVMNPLAREFVVDGAEGTLPLLAKVHLSMDCLNNTLADLSVLGSGAREVVVLNKDRIGELVDNATAASTHLKQGIKELKLHPWKLFFQPSNAEKRELHILNVAREFTEAAAHLDDAATRLQALLDAQQGQLTPEDPQLEHIRIELQDAVHQYRQAEEALWQEINRH